MASQTNRVSVVATSVTDTATDVNYAGALVRNESSSQDVWLDFDKTAAQASGFRLRQADGVVRFDFEFDKLHMITDTNSATVSVIKIAP